MSQDQWDNVFDYLLTLAFAMAFGLVSWAFGAYWWEGMIAAHCWTAHWFIQKKRYAR